MQATAPKGASDKVGRALVHMIRKTEEALESAARVQGLHPTDFRCIGYLDSQPGPVSPKDIANQFSLTSGAVTALLDRLDKAGFIRRLPNPDDRRGLLIVLDREAAAEPLSRYAQTSAKYAAATQEFSDADLEKIERYLRRVATIADELNESLYRTLPDRDGTA